MAQFSVYHNKNPNTQADIPYLVDVQSDLLNNLATRIVIPLYLQASLSLKPINTLTPELQIAGKSVILMTPQMAGISVKDLGDKVCEITQHRNDIIASIDLLITGF